MSANRQTAGGGKFPAAGTRIMLPGETGRRFKKGRSVDRNRQAQLLWNKAKDGDASTVAAVRDLTKKNFDDAMRREDGRKIVADKMKPK